MDRVLLPKGNCRRDSKSFSQGELFDRICGCPVKGRIRWIGSVPEGPRPLGLKKGSVIMENPRAGATGGGSWYNSQLSR